MWGQTKKLAMVLAIAGSLSACASQGGMQGMAGNAFTGEVGTDAAIEVTNYNWADMTVYAVRNGTRVRLGSVMSMSTEQFQLPRGMVGTTDMRIMADPVGSRHAYHTRPVLVVPGQTLQLRLENNIELSSVSVW